MNYQQFKTATKGLTKNHAKFRSLCEQYPHYHKASMAVAWSAIARIRARKRDKVVDNKEPVV